MLDLDTKNVAISNYRALDLGTKNVAISNYRIVINSLNSIHVCTIFRIVYMILICQIYKPFYRCIQL